MERRDFLKSLGLGASGLVFPLVKNVIDRDRISQRKLPNIVIIMADDMGLGDPGCYNLQSLIPTPHIDRIAAEGMRLTDAHSPAALCTPTRYSLLTGRYSWRTWLKKGVLMPYWPPLIEPSRMTIASLLRSRGYETIYIGKWHLGLKWKTKDGSKAEEIYSQEKVFETDETLQWRIDFSQPVGGGPTELGFDYFYGTAGCSSSDPPYVFIENNRLVAVPTKMSKEEWRGLPGFVPGPMADDWSEENIDVILAEKAKEAIDRHLQQRPNDPFFLIFSANSPHIPWLVPEFMKGKSKEGPRGDLVALFDWAVGEVDAYLKKRGISDNTLFIVTSDNGGQKGANGHKSEMDFRGYKGSIWEGGHRVPFIVRWPGKVKAGEISDELISLVDMFATFSELIGMPLPDDAAEDSWSILPVLLGKSLGKPLHEALVFQAGNGDLAIRQGRWKLIVPQENGGRVQLYDLEADPGEKRDVAADNTSIVATLSTLLEKYKQQGYSRPMINRNKF
ncbi:MAG: arylsulfatase [Candidatus Aminicenantes bacterium]|nr:arylsulfatase [Candidatus Aminicenantes bacterium]